jgi:hypothetical protein
LTAAAAAVPGLVEQLHWQLAAAAAVSAVCSLLMLPFPLLSPLLPQQTCRQQMLSDHPMQ